PPQDAEGKLATSYRKLGAPPARLDQIILAHGQRPHTLDGHMALYRAVLQHGDNRLDRAFAEAIGVLISRINGCDYCVSHHVRGMVQELGDHGQAQQWLTALLNGGRLDRAFSPAQQLALDYAERLTRVPCAVDESLVEALKRSGWDDGEILEINQVSAYFAYVNRTVLGLGVTTDGE
ncbi:MAG: carboxymuconolactone decarboxylase family protein, partial [Wenzhouxiangellaceae bacterium]